MRARIACSILLMIGLTRTSAQIVTPTEFFVRGGAAFPVSSQSFTDYWKNGFALGAGVGTPLGESSTLLVSLDYARFSFDQTRLLQYFSMPPAGNSISGASSTLIVLSAHARVLQPIIENLSLYVTGGAGMVYSGVAAATVTYSGYSATAQPTNRLSFALAPGIGFTYPLQDRWSVFAEARYYWAILRKTDAHAGFSETSIGLRSAL